MEANWEYIDQKDLEEVIAIERAMIKLVRSKGLISNRQYAQRKRRLFERIDKAEHENNGVKNEN